MDRMVIGMPEMGADHFRRYMREKYVACIRRAGGHVEEIPWGVSDRDLWLLSEEWDGVLLPGGGDIEPALYGRAREPGCGEPTPERDELEPRIFRLALGRELPVLGICRGAQMIDVVRGGTLFQDMGSGHSDFPRRQGAAHAVTVEPGSLLAAAVGAGELQVNSMHHQAVDRVGEGLRITARGADGYVEALELEGYPFCLAVQWHPEHLADRDPRQQAIFELFLLACRRERALRLMRAPVPDPELGVEL